MLLAGVFQRKPINQRGKDHGFFSTDIETIDDLFVHTLRGMYYAEQQILQTLSTMVEKATNPDLKSAFEKHLAETQGHVRRIEEVFEDARRRASDRKLPGHRWHP
jgi:ferritin-like metal-binding protein YciE